MTSNLDSHKMMLRRINDTAWQYFFPDFEIDTKTKCPFCGHPKSFRIFRQHMEPRIYKGNCEVLTCAFLGDGETLIQRRTRLDHGYVQKILALFDSKATHEEIAAEINRMIEAQRLEKRRTFQS